MRQAVNKQLVPTAGSWLDSAGLFQQPRDRATKGWEIHLGHSEMEEEEAPGWMLLQGWQSDLSQAERVALGWAEAISE